MNKIEIVLTKQGKTFKDYRHLTITEGREICIVNFIKGRLYPDKKTMNPTYESYPVKQDAIMKVISLLNWMISKPMFRRVCS
ncbi:hypothetical protein [Paenibacillus radicis (ex Gao et al. 2016)]|uniref:Uncharacterized protein n=1 Tax=Paenibacillus radicis (ex Gao et al. 2016) TaxID=1737354 RepID=A0A917HGR2_9BACL|nr:hypothetical protein [Paenibacillus radicis (ex Gao et al. 2016)]GGG78682.1 hypothetical protein GCM10010918_39560 [Paenibacillus radicis (ex Gao et al. 2016)]